MQNSYGGIFSGDGWGCQFGWSGDTTGPVFELAGCIQCNVGNFSIQLNGSYPTQSLIEIQSADISSSGNTLHDITGDCGAGSTANWCQFGVTVNGPDANNDFHAFNYVRLLGYSICGFNLNGSQSYSHTFNGSQAIGLYQGGTGQYGVCSQAGGFSTPSGYAASFTWNGGGMGNTVYDFFIQGITVAPIHVDNPDDEGAGGFLKSTGGAAVYVKGGRIYDGTGSLTIDFAGQNLVLDGTYLAPNSAYGGTNLLTMRYNPQQIGGSPAGAFLLQGVTLSTINFLPSQLFPTGVNNVIFQNAQWTDATGNATGLVQQTPYTTGTVTTFTGSTDVQGAGTAADFRSRYVGERDTGWWA